MARKKNFKMQNNNVNKNLTSNDNHVKISNANGGIYANVKLIFEEDFKKEQKKLTSQNKPFASVVVSKRLKPLELRVFNAICTLIKEKEDENYSFSANEILLKSGIGRGKDNLLKLDMIIRKLSTTFIYLDIRDEFEKRKETRKDYSSIMPYFLKGSLIIRTQMIQLTTGFRAWRGEEKIYYKIDKIPVLMQYNEIWNTFINVPVSLLKSSSLNNIQVALTDYLIQRIRGIKKGLMEDLVTIVDLQRKVEEQSVEKIDKTHFPRFAKKVLDFLELAKQEKEILDYTPIRKKKKLFAVRIIVKKQSDREKAEDKIIAVICGDLKK